ncbi:MAG: hypothetical protein CVU06_05525, partial [Bacteroidetes bacterium HGW-Bacteroidetes-22]
MKKLIITWLFCVSLLPFVRSQEVEYHDGSYYKNGMLYTGLFIEKYNDEKVKSEREIKNGKEDGIVKFYYPSGVMQEQRAY